MTKAKKTIFGVMALIIMAMPIFVTQTAQAQFSPDSTRGRALGVTKTGKTDLVEILFSVIGGLLKIVFVIAVLMFVISGIYFLTSAGTDRADTARDILTYAIIGLVVSVLGYGIILYLGKILIGDTVGSGAGAGITIQAN